MSPLLEISLAIVAIFWVIPLSWAVYTFVRSIPDRTMAALSYIYSLPRNIKRIRDNARFQREQLELKRQQKILQGEYQKVQDKLIVHRKLVADSVLTQKRLNELQAKLEGQIDHLKAEGGECRISETYGQELHALVVDLSQVQEESAKQELIMNRLRDELSELEVEVQAKYTYNQIQIAKDKAYAAEREVKRLLLRDPKHLSALMKMENKVLQKESAIYGKFLLEDQYVSFPRAAKSLERLSIEKLELDELNELFEAVDQSGTELCRILHSAVSYERVLSLQAELESDPEQFMSMIEASKICTQEFMRLHDFFAVKEREIFDKISSVETSRSTEEQSLPQ